MAKRKYSQFEQVDAMRYGNGRLVVMSWRTSEAAGRRLAVPVLLQEPETGGTVPRWPTVVANPSSWREAKAFVRRIKELPPDVQLELSWVTDVQGFKPFTTADELEDLIATAEFE